MLYNIVIETPATCLIFVWYSGLQNSMFSNDEDTPNQPVITVNRERSELPEVPAASLLPRRSQWIDAQQLIMLLERWMAECHNMS